jgi:hypothetical protein
MKKSILAATLLLASAGAAVADHLVTTRDIPACKTQDTYDLLWRAMGINDMKTLRELIRAKSCIIWPAGTVLHLDETVPGDGPLHLPGVTRRGIIPTTTRKSI